MQCKRWRRALTEGVLTSFLGAMSLARVGTLPSPAFFIHPEKGGLMLSEEQLREMLRQLTEIREHLHQLSLHVVQMFTLVDEVLEKMEGPR